MEDIDSKLDEEQSFRPLSAAYGLDFGWQITLHVNNNTKPKSCRLQKTLASFRRFSEWLPPKSKVNLELWKGGSGVLGPVKMRGFPLPLLPISQGGFKNLLCSKILSPCANYSLKCKMQLYNTFVCYLEPSVSFQLNWTEELISWGYYQQASQKLEVHYLD